MHSFDHPIVTTQPARDCVVVARTDGTVAWTSPGARDLLAPNSRANADAATTTDLFGPAIADADPGSVVEASVPTENDADVAIEVTVDAVDADSDLRAYHCQVARNPSLEASTVLSRVTDGVIALDTDWRYTYANERAAELVDVPVADLLGENVWEAFSELAGTELRTRFERAMDTQESVSFEWNALTLDVWFEIRAFPSPSGLTVYFEDVTDRKERELALEDQRDVVHELLHLTPIGISVLDTDGNFVRVNERSAEILGVPREVLLEESLDDQQWGLHYDDESPVPDEERAYYRVLETGKPAHGVEYSLERPDGTRVWVSVSAAPVFGDDGSIERVVVGFDDVTERKEATEVLEDRERQFRAVFEGTLDALVLADDDGELVAANEATRDLLGLEEDELLGRTCEEFMHCETDFEATWAQFLDDGSKRGEFPLRRPNGEARTLDYVATANVRPGEHLFALRDVTDRKEAERRLEAQRDELDRLNRINELIRDVNRTIVGATDRSTVEKAVCRTLGDADQYPVAVTFRSTSDDDLQVEHVAGPACESVAAVRAADVDVVERTLGGVVRSNESMVLRDLTSATSYPKRLREIAREHGIETFLFVPLSYEGVVHGVLGVGAVRADAFGDEERAVFAELGQIIGTAIDAFQTKRLLHANAFTELELAVSSERMPMVALNALAGGTWSLEGVVPLDDHSFLFYVDGEGVDAATLESAAADLQTIDRVRILDADDDRTLFELRVSDASPVTALVDAGGRIQRATVENGRVQFVVDVTAGTDVRAYLSRVAQRDVSVELLAKREVDRTAPATGFESTSDIELTSRQRSVLEAAYLSGYFEWPRRRTSGEELAASLHISSSTLHQHLRVALEKVLRQYLRVTSTQPTE